MKPKEILAEVPDELEPLERLLYCCCSFGWRPLEEPDNEEDKQTPVYREWERFKASKFYPERFSDWIDYRMGELGYAAFKFRALE